MMEAIRALNLALRGGDAPRTDIEWRAKAMQLMDAGEQVMTAYGIFISRDTVPLETYRDYQLRALDAIDKANKRADAAEQDVAELKRMHDNAIRSAVAVTEQREQLRLSLASLRELCAAAYQALGAAGGPVEMLDNLSDAASGDPLRHDPGAGLPFSPEPHERGLDHLEGKTASSPADQAAESAPK